MGSPRNENKGDQQDVRPKGPILLGLGANLSSPTHGAPRATLEAALSRLGQSGLRVVRCSRWWQSTPIPVSDQPWYVNGVAEIATKLAPEPLLALLHEIEAEFGRVRSYPNAPRLLDLDLLAYGNVRRDGPMPPLLPLQEIEPGWRHPVSKRSLAEMISALPAGHIVRPFP